MGLHYRLATGWIYNAWIEGLWKAKTGILVSSFSNLNFEATGMLMPTQTQYTSSQEAKSA